ncbi:hypothetical protein JOM56_010924 [Amanita muscaria]
MFEAFEAAQNACIGPQYEPPAPMVLTVIREKEKGSQRVSRSRRGALETGDGFPGAARSSGTQRRKLTADVRGWEPRHPTVFEVLEASKQTASPSTNGLCQPAWGAGKDAIASARSPLDSCPAALPPDANADSHDLHGGPGGEDIIGNAHSPEAAQNACIGPQYGPPTPTVLTVIREKEKGSQREQCHLHARFKSLQSPSMGDWTETGDGFPGVAHSSGTRRRKLTADVRGWEPRHPTVFEVLEAAQNACIGPLYEPPSPVVLTVIRDKEKDNQRVNQSRRGALGSPKVAVPPACVYQQGIEQRE